jgi:hypothetical protein
MVGKGTNGLGWICSFASSTFGSLIQKTVTLDASSELLNMQWIPDISQTTGPSALTSGYNIYLIIIPKAPNSYINILMFDDSLNYQNYAI